MWQQKLSASGVATFCWQDNDESLPDPLEDPKPGSHEKPIESFHNPALAAIRASQQFQELASKGDVNGSHDRVQTGVDGLGEGATEHVRTFKEHRDTNGSESPSPGFQWTHPSSNIDSSSHLKRRISEVSDVEAQPARPPPSLEPHLYQPTTVGPAVLNPSLSHLYPSPPPKRKPDPNDDTIGSDLDDSDDEGDINSDVEDGDDNMPLMLCLYDKVHRTKNKWRANMSHGIVCINGREWVFEKGNGEYEW
jgi:hypothetical protein